MHPFKSHKPCFSKAPEAFYSIDVGFAINKLITSMIHPEVFFISHIDQAVVTTPLVRMNDAVKIYSASNNSLQRSFRAIWHYLSIYLAIASKDSEHDGFTIGASTSFSFNSFSAKERFINFNLATKGRIKLTKLSTI